MSRPTRQQRVLDQIEHSLHACEPQLASMFAMFTTLTKDEAIPRQEKLPSRPSPLHLWRNRPAGPRRGRPAATGARTARPWATRLASAILVMIMPLALTAAVLLGLGGRSVTSCSPAIRPEHTAPALSRRTTCRPGLPLVMRQRPLSG